MASGATSCRSSSGSFGHEPPRREAPREEGSPMNRSDALFAAAQRVIPGGVNSPVRAFRGVGGRPFFVDRASGARIWDVDGHDYLDFLGSWGPLVLGHAAPAVVEAVIDAARRGMSYGAPTGREVEIAEAITEAYPSMEMVRLVSSGTEAAMTAIRVARGATGRDVILKFDGGYHGHADSLLVKAGSGGATFSLPDSRGVPGSVAALTLTVPFNDQEAMRRALPVGGVARAGTLSGNPLAVAAGLATLGALRDPALYARLERLGALLQEGLETAARKAGVALTVNRVGSMLTGFFCEGPVTDYASAQRSDTVRYARYFHAMLQRGMFLAPSQFEAAFVSLAHTEADLHGAADAAAEAMARIA